MQVTELIKLFQPGWDRVADGVSHPVGPQGSLEKGVLIRNQRTGIYMLATFGGWRSVPQRWAKQVHAEQTS